MTKKSISIFTLLMGILVFTYSCQKGDDESVSDDSTNGKTTANFNPNITYGTMTDQDGNVYKTVTIGTQIWMAENLRTTKYNDGTAIDNVIDGDEWANLKTGAYCNYNNLTGAKDIATYGRLYNWYAVNTGKLAPVGWHIPSDAEWTQLVNYLGGEDSAGGKLKETGTLHWESPNTEATNETGFTALPGGYRDYHGTYCNNREYGYWWSTSEIYNSAWRQIMSFHYGYFSGNYFVKENGFSVRCVKD